MQQRITNQEIALNKSKMSNRMQDTSLHIGDENTDDNTDDIDVIELTADHNKQTNPFKEQTDTPVKKQNGFTMDFMANDEELLIIELQDVETAMSNDQRARLQSFDEMRDLNNDKKYEEWVYVETNQKTYQIHDNLLLVSSVYDDSRSCCVLQWRNVAKVIYNIALILRISDV